MFRVILVACLSTWLSSGGQLLAQAEQHPRLSFRVIGEPLPNQWQTTVILVRAESVLVSGTELERPGHRLHAWLLGANGSQLSVQICGFGRPLEPLDSVGPAPNREPEQDDEERATSAPPDSMSPEWRRVGYEFAVAPLRPGTYTLAIAGCALQDGTVEAEKHRLTLP